MNRDTIIAFILIGIILIFTQTSYYKKMVMPKRATVPPKEAVEDTLHRKSSAILPQKGESASTGEVSKVVSKEKTASKASVQSQQKPLLKNLLPAEESSLTSKTITIRNNLYEAKISSRGAVVSSWELFKYDDGKGHPVQLIAGNGYNDLGLSFVVGGDTVDFGKVNYIQEIVDGSPNDTLITLNNQRDSARVVYTLNLTGGKKIQKIFTFYNNKYNFDLDVRLLGFDSWVSNKSYNLLWKSGLRYTEKRIRDDEGYAKVYTMFGKDLDEFSIGNKKIYKKKELSGNLKWGAVRTKYFTAAMISPHKQGRGAIVEGRGVPINAKYVFKRYGITMEMPLNSGELTNDHFTIFIGPLEYNTTRKLGVKLDKVIMASGWYERFFRPFSIAILVSFKFLHKFIPNYGWVIVIFSILIKILVYPLTHKSYISMKKMQLVQPKMAEIKEKYKNDPQRLNKETMKLYKEYGVNPMGGCLPTLLQMPLLVGLFIVFRSTIELRHASFIWWIKDLSMPDTIATLPFAIPMYGNTINVLPILMGVTMFFQQKMTTQDPKQKSLTYLMPIFFVLLFNSFPSGLNLYYTLFNLFTIIQQKMVKIEPVELEPKPAKQVAKVRGSRRRK